MAMSSARDTAVPVPPEITCVVDPLFELLTAFPVPQLMATSEPLHSGDSACSAQAASNSKDDEDFANAFLHSARTLMASSSYETLRRISTFEGESDDTNNIRGISSLAQRIHGEMQRVENEQRLHGIGSMKSTQMFPLNHERWIQNDAASRMTLRQRSVSHSGGAASDEPKTLKLEEKPSFLPPPPPPPPPPSVKAVPSDAKCAKPGKKTESYCSWSVSDIVEKGLHDARSCEGLLGMLSTTSQPFKGIDADRLSAFVSGLAKSPSPPPPPTKKTAVSAEVSVEVMERAVACCACLSHPSFDLSLLAGDTVDHLITTFAAVVRQVARWFSSSASSEVSSGVELRCLRAMLRCFTVIAYDMRVNVCMLGDLLRLEDICFQCLLVVANNGVRSKVTNYASYVMSHAVHLYHCLWNRLELQRDATLERFFPRLCISDNVQLRLYLLPSGVNIMVLTATLVAAAQSTPICSETITRIHAEHLQQQCRTWALVFLQHFVIMEREDKKERDMCGIIVLQLCEDLAHMVGMPEYPAADLLLRFLFTTLVQCCFHAPSAGGSASSDLERLRPLFVDAVFRVSYALFSALQRDDLHASQLPALCPLSTSQLEQWYHLSRAGNVTNGEALELSGVNMHRAVLYMALSRFVNDPALDVAFTSFHTRAAHIFTWVLHDPHIPEASLDHLVRTMHVADGGLSLERNVLHAYSVQISSGQEKSMLSSMARERLLAWLLSVFQVREEQHGAGLEVARKKTLLHVAKLTSLYPPLLEKIWPIAHHCVRDESSRVREAIVPLLLTLLSEICRGVGFAKSRVEEVFADVISSLLHLLSDRSATVASRAIAALDTLLSDPPFKQVLETASTGEHLLTFTQSKLLSAMMNYYAKEGRNQTDVVRLFLHHWVGKDPTEVASHYFHARVARELVRLTIASMSYPYEVSESFHLVVLLRGMCQVAETHETLRRKTKRTETDSQELRGVMIGAAKMLWEEHQRLTPASEAAASMAVIHIMAMVCSEWVEPLLEVLLQTLVQQQQQPSLSPLSSPSSPSPLEAEAVGVTLLHVCRILRTVLLAPRLPSFSLDSLARALMALLSRYVGPHQRYILLSASGVLTATITCGRDKFSNQVNTKYLMLCYSLMNTYYVRTLALLPSLRTDSHSVAYTLRFLFLLSEFLRLYPGWRHHHQELTEDTAAGGGGVSNQLARGDGICANMYAVVEKVLQHSPEEAQMKTAVIGLRVLGSLCILHPTVFFHRCKPYIHRALNITEDVSLQTQGLLVIRDFLKDEDARIDYAASVNAPVPASSHTSSPSSTPPVKEKKKKTADTTRWGRRIATHRRDELQVQISPCMEEQNSGMATWVMQEFHVEVLQLCESTSMQVRELALEVLQLCAQGGLLPPSKYVSSLILLAADPESDAMRVGARECLTTHNERYADIVASNAATGVIKTFDLHAACKVDVLHSAILNATGLQAAECCVHTHLFLLLRKRHRDALVSSLLRYFYQDGRAVQWLRDHKGSGCGTNPLLFLGHLAVVLACIPYPLESDVLHVLDSCCAAVDLAGQTCLDFTETQLKLLQKKKNTSCSSSRRGGAAAAAATAAAAGSADATKDMIELWKCFGILCITQLSEFLRQEYSLHSAKLQRIAMRSGGGGPHHTTSIAHRKTQTVVSTVFRQTITDLVRAVEPLWDTAVSELSTRRHALEELHTTLSRVLQEDVRAGRVSGGIQARTRGKTARTTESTGKKGRRSRRTLEEASNSGDSGSDFSSNDDHSANSSSSREDADSSDTE